MTSQTTHLIRLSIAQAGLLLTKWRVENPCVADCVELLDEWLSNAYDATRDLEELEVLEQQGE